MLSIPPICSTAIVMFLRAHPPSLPPPSPLTPPLPTPRRSRKPNVQLTPYDVHLPLSYHCTSLDRCCTLFSAQVSFATSHLQRYLVPEVRHEVLLHLLRRWHVSKRVKPFAEQALLQREEVVRQLAGIFRKRLSFLSRVCMRCGGGGRTSQPRRGGLKLVKTNLEGLAG